MVASQRQLLLADDFLKMLKLGAQRVISKEALLNQMNVFPVTDRDTGSNMAALMRFILAQSYDTSHLKTLLQQIADVTLGGACGNSGMIFSAFFTGLAANEVEFRENAFSLQLFIACIRKGVQQAYQAVSEPMEGTMLTVMSSWADACEKASLESKDFKSLFEKALVAAGVALKNTQYQLAILAQNKIVDAGALGFFEFIVGMNEYLNATECGEEESEWARVGALVNLGQAHVFEQQSNYHYCAQTLLSCDRQATDQLKEELKEMGDSLVVNQGINSVKVHVHTSDVVAMTKTLRKFGSIQHQKIDSMKSQWDVVHHRKNTIALLTDSSADLPSGWIEKEQIHVLPLHIHLGEDLLLDGLSIELQDLYQAIHERQVSAKTAAPSPEAVSRYLTFLAEHYESIIVITLSSHLSSTYQIISQLAHKMENKKITVIDSRKNSVAQGLLLMLANKWIKQGVLHEKVVEQVKQARDDTQIFVAVNEFKTMMKLGRAPKIMGMLALWSQFKPIVTLSLSGKPSMSGFAFGQAACWRKIAKQVKKIKLAKGIGSLGVVHTSSFELAREFARFIEKEVKVKVDFITEASCTIGLHAGKGCVAVALAKETIEGLQ